MRATEEQHLGEALLTRGDLAGEWDRPGLDVAADVRVAELHGRVVGLGQQYHGRAEVAVLPAACGLGIGTALAAWTEQHARAAGLQRVGQTLPVADTVGHALLAARGYRPLWESWIFRRELGRVDIRPQVPTGVVLRTIRRPEDDAPLYALIDRAFSEWPDRDPAMGLADWRASMLDRDGMDDALVLVAEVKGTLVGAAVCIVDGPEGWIEQLAVAREWRGRGLGRALLHAAFHRFAARGLGVAGLATDSRTGARGLYEHVGMQVTHTLQRVSLPLP